LIVCDIEEDHADMPVDITIPTAGESITEVRLGPWHHRSGEWVQKDELLVEIETDKTTLELPAPESGVLKVMAQTGEDKQVGDRIGTIDPEAPRPNGAVDSRPAATQSPAGAASAPPRQPAPQTRPRSSEASAADGQSGRVTPVARKLAADKGVDLARVQGTGPSGRVTKADVLAVAESVPTAHGSPASIASPALQRTTPGGRNARRERMTKLRARIAQRLVEAQHTAAMLTTFNECDMGAIIDLRKQHKEEFEKAHGVGLGFMSFFVKAAVSALQRFPRVNAFIVGDDEIEYHDFCDVSVAVGTEKGLVVPVLRNAESMTFADVELSIKDLATRARDGKLSIEEMTGGTFTITNGGVYGSLNSTPILNPPQSAILGMHAIKSRPVEYPVGSGQIALRPMMYLALSYDHRMVDGAEAVSFLVHIRNCIENPQRMLLGL
jgi:2-oxoglutarate dehydrogenase E2 component (dihydrolipoamide succinyltransferase)